MRITKTTKGLIIFGSLLLSQCNSGQNQGLSQTLTATCTLPTHQEPANTGNSLDDAMRNYSNYLPVFPGAQGFGTITPAGRGPNPCKHTPEVVVVSNLNSTGKGSLQAALEGNWQKPRFVVFTVGGTIDLAVNRKHQDIDITSPYVTVAGQTAPAPGITLKNGTLNVLTHDVLIQHLRTRPGDETCKGNGDCDNLDGVQIVYVGDDVYNVVIDHSSSSWGVDENVSTWVDEDGGRMSDITISNSIISNGLDGTKHSKGRHSMGLLVGDHTKRISLIGNILAHNRNRNPLFKGDTSGIIANNLIYNKGWEGITLLDDYGSGPSLVSIVGNVILPGPNTSTTSKGILIYDDVKRGTKVFVSDNEWNWQNGRTLSEQWSMAVTDQNPDVEERVDSAPVWINPFILKPSSQVMTSVLAQAGAFPRDNIDGAIVANISSCQLSKNYKSCPGGFITSPPLNAWSTSKVTRSLKQAATESKCLLPTPDRYWLDNDGDGYSNFEEWLHAMTTYVEKAQKCGST